MISLPSPPPSPLSSPLREEAMSGHFWLQTSGCILPALGSCQPFEGPNLPRTELWGLLRKSKTNPLEQPRSRAQTSRHLWPSLLLHGLLQLCSQARASADKLGAASSFLTAPEVLQVHNHEHIFGFSGEVRVCGFTTLASLRRGWEQLLRISPDASFQRQTV